MTVATINIFPCSERACAPKPAGVPNAAGVPNPADAFRCKAAPRTTLSTNRVQPTRGCQSLRPTRPSSKLLDLCCYCVFISSCVLFLSSSKTSLTYIVTPKSLRGQVYSTFTRVTGYLPRPTTLLGQRTNNLQDNHPKTTETLPTV